MAEPNETTSQNQCRHIIAMDGGGIYGLATAKLLRRLCAADPRFMIKEEMENYLFAGTSAGALNALILAHQDDPRQFLLDGGLEDFWETCSVFEPPENFWAWYWSFFGVTAWFGTKKYIESLNAHFGNTIMQDLKHNVLVAVFDYSGRGLHAPKWAGGKSWGPSYFSNLKFEINLDIDIDFDFLHNAQPVADVAYAATAPAGYRTFLKGLGDGGATLPSPELYALTLIARDARKKLVSMQMADKDVFVSELSVGVCSTPWYYWQDNANWLGYNMFWNVHPTNPQRGNWYAPVWDFNVSAPTATSNQQVANLLGQSYFRLNPALLGPPNMTPPVLVAMMMSRNPLMFNWLISEIEKAVRTPVAQEAVDAALAYLASEGWLAGHRYNLSVDSDAVSG